jgi:FtsZ-binding cell division protein ZapB
MVSLEQVKLLESKVARAIDYVERVSGENAVLQEKLDSYQKRIDELEVLVQRFKEDQGRIEDGILAALDRLNQFEDAIEKSLALRGSSPSPAEAVISEARAKAPPPAPEEVSETEESPEPEEVPETEESPETEDAGEEPEGEEPSGEDEKDTGTAVDSGELDIF